MSSFSVFDHKPGHCGLTKLIPAERLTSFSIYHYYQQRHVSWTPVFQAAENMMAGYHYYAVPKVPLNIPKCWRKLVSRHYAEQYPSPTLAPAGLIDADPSADPDSEHDPEHDPDISSSDKSVVNTADSTSIIEEAGQRLDSPAVTAPESPANEQHSSPPLSPSSPVAPVVNPPAISIEEPESAAKPYPNEDIARVNKYLGEKSKASRLRHLR